MCQLYNLKEYQIIIKVINHEKDGWICYISCYTVINYSDYSNELGHY